MDAALSVLFMNGIFMFPVMIQMFTEIGRLCAKNAEDLDGSSEEPGYVAYGDNLTTRQARMVNVKKLQMRTLFLFVISAVCSIGGFCILMWQGGVLLFFLRNDIVNFLKLSSILLNMISFS